MVNETLIPSRVDLLFMAKWPILRLAAAFLPERAWFNLAMRVEQTRVLLGRPAAVGAETIRRALSLTDRATAKNIASRLAANRTEHFIQVLKSSRSGWIPEIQVEGRAHLETAVAQGKGTILWQAPFCFTHLVTKMGLKAAGYQAIHLGLAGHGFSDSPFAIRFLNPQLIRTETRYLRQRITIDPENPGAALTRAWRELANNGLVSVNIGAWAGRTVIRAAFLGGSLPLAVGAPGLAHRTGAALLPVFTTRMPGSSAFVIRIGAPLPTSGAESETAIHESVAALVTQLEAAVCSAPDQWISWEYLAFDEMTACDRTVSAPISVEPARLFRP